MDRIKRAATQFADKLTKTGLERMLKEATEDTEWGAANTLLYNIADRSHNSADCTFILEFVVESLKARDRDWHRIFKTLTLMEVLLKLGSINCVMGLRENSYRVRSLQDFSYNDKGTERGNGIREKSRTISVMLADQSYLEEERQRAKLHREKFAGISSDAYSIGVTRPVSSYNPHDSGPVGYESPTVPQPRPDSSSMFSGISSRDRAPPQPVHRPPSTQEAAQVPNLFAGMSVSNPKEQVTAPNLFSRDLFEKKPQVDLLQSQARSGDLISPTPPAPKTEIDLFQGLQPKTSKPPASPLPFFQQTAPVKGPSATFAAKPAFEVNKSSPASSPGLPLFESATSGVTYPTPKTTLPLFEQSAPKASLPLFESAKSPIQIADPSPQSSLPKFTGGMPQSTQARPTSSTPTTFSIPPHTPPTAPSPLASLDGLQLNLQTTPQYTPHLYPPQPSTQYPLYAQPLSSPTLQAQYPAYQYPPSQTPLYKPQYPLQYAPQAAPTFSAHSRMHHNMSDYSGPTIDQIKTSPSIVQKPEKAQPQQASLTSAELEARMTNLDGLQI